MRTAKHQPQARVPGEREPAAGSRPQGTAAAVEKAISLIAARAMPERRLREKLAARFPAEDVAAAVARLRELRLVDDRAWAERFVRERSETRGKGRHRIRSELLARGIDAATAEAAIATVLDDEAERQRAAAVLGAMRARLAKAPLAPERLAESPPTRSRGVDRHRDTLDRCLFRRMIARGFPATLVRDLLGVS